MTSNGKNNAQSNQNSQNMARPAQPSDVRLRTPSRVPLAAMKKARRRAGAGDTRKNPSVEFQPSQILRENASEKQKRSRYSRGAPLAAIARPPVRISAPCASRIHVSAAPFPQRWPSPFCRLLQPRRHQGRAPIVYPRHAASLVRQRRSDGCPFIVRESVAHDPGLPLWRLE
jgi:hypothetical protein